MTSASEKTYTKAIECKNLNFDFGGPQILFNVNLELPRGACCLLVGANGAGKSTILRLFAGKRLVHGDIFVMEKRAFLDAPSGVTYLGTEWASNPIVRRDVPVSRLLKSQGAERHPERCAELLETLDVNPNWHMHQVSDGERRRVQIVLGLLEPWDVLLLDEVTVDLDVVVRSNLVKFLKKETQERGSTVVYATHIFDGLGGFPTHIVHMAKGTIDIVREIEVAFYELEEERTKSKNEGIDVIDNSPLLRVVERWLREDYRKRFAIESQDLVDGRPRTKWDILSENMKAFGDKYYNYWN